MSFKPVKVERYALKGWAKHPRTEEIVQLERTVAALTPPATLKKMNAVNAHSAKPIKPPADRAANLEAQIDAYLHTAIDKIGVRVGEEIPPAELQRLVSALTQVQGALLKKGGTDVDLSATRLDHFRSLLRKC